MTSLAFQRALDGRYSVQHTLYTINGFLGDPNAMMPADTARALGNKVNWVEVIYNSGAFPLGVGVTDGTNVLTNLIASTPGTFMIAAYSEGTIIAKNVEQEIVSGSLSDRNDDWVASVKWGDACREAHKWFGSATDPGGEGISGPDNWVNTDPRIRSFVYEQNFGDVYTNRPLTAAGDRMTLAYQFIIERWSGLLTSLVQEFADFVKEPPANVESIIMAVVQYLIFVGPKAQAPHMDYPIDDAVAYLNQRIIEVPARTVTAA